MLIRHLDVLKEVQGYEVDVVTLEGDEIKRKGVIIGGYYEKKVLFLNV